jgi:hypothetical protein
MIVATPFLLAERADLGPYQIDPLSARSISARGDKMSVKITPRATWLAALLAALLLCSQGACDRNKPYPSARRGDVSETLHGAIVTDPYRWLEDQASPETRAWIQEENAYTRAFLDRWPGRAALVKRLTELDRVETIEAPIKRGERLFFRKRLPDQEQAVIYMRQERLRRGPSVNRSESDER